MAFTFTARISGDPTEPELQDAVRKVAGKYPALSVRVSAREHGIPEFTTRDVPQPSLRIVSDAGENGWTEVVKEELSVPFNWVTGPLVRYVFVKGKDLSTIVGVFHHGIADGLSASYVMRDIVHYLAYPNDEIEVVRPVDPGVIPDFSPDASGFPFDVPPASETVHPENLPSSFGPPQFELQHWLLDRDFTSALLMKTRSENTSVHAALGTAFMLAFADVNGEQNGYDRQLQTPISLRDRIPELEGGDVGVFMDIVLSGADCSPGRDFWDVARDLKKNLLMATDPENMSGMFSIMRAMLKKTEDIGQLIQFMATQIGTAYDISLSNLGKLDIVSRRGRFDLESLYGPTFAAMGTDRIVGVNTFDGRMFFTFICQEATLDKNAMSDLRIRAMRILSDAVSG